MIYGILAASWALLAGYAGQFSFGHMAFASLGGYTSALLVQWTHLPIPLGMASGTVVCAVLGSLIGWVCLRMRGPYLAIFTLAFAEIVRIILLTEYAVTNGPAGLRVPHLLGTPAKLPYYYIALGLLAVCLVTMSALAHSRWGFFFRAIREDEEAAAASGVHVVRAKMYAFAAASSFAGLAGAFYAHYIGILTPELGSPDQMGLVVAMAILGGIESLPAAVGGAGRGELVGLIGPNGSGKTTLVNLLTGHLAPDSGEIFLGGHQVTHLPAYRRARYGVGRTFQMSQLFRRMTVLENMLVPGLTFPHLSREVIAARARAHLRFLGLNHLETLPARSLSGGQQKLLELGRALMLDPTLLLLDEPFAGVHPTLRDGIIERILQLHASGRTFLIVDHDIEAIQQLATRLVVMARGRVVADGSPAGVRGNRAGLAGYAGT